MEYINCTICGLQYEWSDEINLRITNKYFAANGENFYQQCEIMSNLSAKNDHLELNEHKDKKSDFVKHVRKRNINSKDSYFKNSKLLAKQTKLSPLEKTSTILIPDIFLMIHIFTN